jgi:hypothetical protein
VFGKVISFALEIQLLMCLPHSKNNIHYPQYYYKVNMEYTIYKEMINFLKYTNMKIHLMMKHDYKIMGVSFFAQF